MRLCEFSWDVLSGKRGKSMIYIKHLHGVKNIKLENLYMKVWKQGIKN